MEPELKAALDALNMSLSQAAEAQAKALDEYRTASEANDKARDGVVDEKLAKLEAELNKFEPLNEAINKAEAREKEMQETLDKIEARLQRPGSGTSDEDAKAKDYRDAFFAWTRRGDQAWTGDRQNVLQVSDDQAAGYLAAPEFVADILKGIEETSPMRGLVTVRRTSKRSVQMPRRIGRGAATWVGEVEERPNTEGLAYGMDDIPVFEANMRVPVSLQMLEDADFDIENEIRESVVEGFGEQEGQAVISGNASKKPQGILNGVGYVSISSGVTNDITADNLISLKYGIKTGYARNGSYILNRPTLGKIRKMKDGNGQYLWASGLAAGRANTIDGETYSEMPDMPNVGTGLKPVAYGDWKKAYMLVDRLDMTMLRDPYTAASHGQVIFNWRRRFGGAVRLGEAYAVLVVS